MLPPRVPKRNALSWPLRMALRIVLSLTRKREAVSRMVSRMRDLPSDSPVGLFPVASGFSGPEGFPKRMPTWFCEYRQVAAVRSAGSMPPDGVLVNIIGNDKKRTKSAGAPVVRSLPTIKYIRRKNPVKLFEIFFGREPHNSAGAIAETGRSAILKIA